MLFVCPGFGNLTFLTSISALSWQAGRKQRVALQLLLFLNSEKLTGSPGTRVTLLGSAFCSGLPGKLSQWLSLRSFINLYQSICSPDRKTDNIQCHDLGSELLYPLGSKHLSHSEQHQAGLAELGMTLKWH